MKNISKLMRIDTKKSTYYNKDKLTREGLRLGSRMGVGCLTKNSFAPGVSLFFLYDLECYLGLFLFLLLRTPVLALSIYKMLTVPR